MHAAAANYFKNHNQYDERAIQKAELDLRRQFFKSEAVFHALIEI